MFFIAFAIMIPIHIILNSQAITDSQNMFNTPVASAGLTSPLANTEPNTTPTLTPNPPVFDMPSCFQYVPPITKELAVYSGPGTVYYRSANGAAQVRTNDWFYVYAKDNGWVLIEYEVGEDVQRFGYIQPSNIISIASIPELPKANVYAITNKICGITDEPNEGGTLMNRLNRGEQVTLLCFYESYAYVEYTGGSDPMRGFILKVYLDIT